jgi:hypothetical protein
MPRTRRRTLGNLLLALALALATRWATRGPSPLQQPQERLIGRWTVVAQVAAPWGTPVPKLDHAPASAATDPLPEIIEFFADGSLRRYRESPEHASALRGRYALYASGEFTMALSRLTEVRRTIHFTGSVTFERELAHIRGRLTDETAGTDTHIALLIRPVR